jgi:iron-sulfur cluster assembly accessory protein
MVRLQMLINKDPTMAETVSTPQTGAIIDVTEAAANKAKEVLKDSSNQGIRVAVVGGGCAGLQYDLKPVEKPDEGDIILEFFGVPFYIHPMVVPYLKGTTIDFSNALMDGGFKFKNPNATSSCGCGTSFGI